VLKIGNTDRRLSSVTFTVLETILGYLENRALLLILDNCEHVIADELVEVDVYAYSPMSLRYLYSSSGVSASSDLGGVAFYPPLKRVTTERY
jgi:hypothetical protein